MPATIVNTLPSEINEIKPGLIPNHFVIPPAVMGSFTSLVINDCYHTMLIPMTEQPPVIINDPAEKVAEAIVNDFMGACMGTEYIPNIYGGIAIPGIFWLSGNVSDTLVKTTHKGLLEQAVKNTTAWFQRLVIIADDEWNRSRQRKLITDLERLACRSLGLEKEWNYDIILANSSSCWACKSNIHPEAMICPNCKTVLNQAELDKRLAVKK